MIISEKRNGQQLIKPVTTLPNVIELSYYANSLVSHFVLDAILVSAATKLAQTHEKQYPNTVSERSVGGRRIAVHHSQLIDFLFSVAPKGVQSVQT